MPVWMEVDSEFACSALAAGATNISARTLAWGAPVYFEKVHAGKVVDTREYNGYDDSDFYAVVWTDVGPVNVFYATTRAACYGSATVDATPEVMAAYKAHLAEDAKKDAAVRAAREAATPAKGKTLKVVKGRKVPKGTVGTCIWVGAGFRGAPRVGIKDATGTVHWTAASNVEVVA